MATAKSNNNKEELEALKERVAALEAASHTEHTLTQGLLEQIADIVIARIIGRINQVLQPAPQQEIASIEE